MYKRKSLFITIIIIRTAITVSSNNWIRIWIGLEINIIAFLPLIIHKKYKNRSAAAITYFLVQRVSRLILIFSILIKRQIYIINEIITIRLLIKLGGAPFHIWVPEVISKLTWNRCLIISTWQKIAPLSMLINIQNNNLIITFTIVISALLGAIGGFNQTSLRKILGYSSINHLSWIIISNRINSWTIYILIYTIIIGILCYTFNNYNLIFINQINRINISNSEKIRLSISILRIGGLPPFLGFLPKWLVIQNIINEENFIVITVIIIIRLITLIYYLRTIIKIIIINSSTQKWIILKSSTNINLIITMTNLRLPLLVIINYK